MLADAVLYLLGAFLTCAIGGIGGWWLRGIYEQMKAEQQRDEEWDKTHG